MRPHVSPTMRPVSVDPVNEMTGIERMVHDRRAGRLAQPVHELDHLGRQPGLEQDLDEHVPGVRHVLGGLEDARVSAHAAPGNIFQVGIAIGKLNGVMMPATPIGRRKLIAHLLRISLGTVWPNSRRPSLAA